MIHRAPMELRLKVRDLARTMEFYTDVLGFAVERTWGPDEEEPEGAILGRGDARLLFFEDDDADDDEDFGMDAAIVPDVEDVIVLDVDDVSERYATIGDEATVLWGPVVYDYGLREFAIEDPDGYRIALCESPDAQKRT